MTEPSAKAKKSKKDDDDDDDDDDDERERQEGRQALTRREGPVSVRFTAIRGRDESWESAS